MVWPVVRFQHTAARRRLGVRSLSSRKTITCFNTQPPEGGWYGWFQDMGKPIVSTHSRPKAAGKLKLLLRLRQDVSTHSRPKAAGHLFRQMPIFPFCFNTQPPEGGWNIETMRPSPRSRFQHTAARRRLGRHRLLLTLRVWQFQHTAARRRLGGCDFDQLWRSCVSTHSRPKAAGPYPVQRV